MLADKEVLEEPAKILMTQSSWSQSVLSVLQGVKWNLSMASTAGEVEEQSPSHRPPATSPLARGNTSTSTSTSSSSSPISPAWPGTGPQGIEPKWSNIPLKRRSSWHKLSVLTQTSVSRVSNWSHHWTSSQASHSTCDRRSSLYRISDTFAATDVYKQEMGARSSFNFRASLLVYKSEEHEKQFEYCFCEPGLLIQPLMFYHILWLIDFCVHKTQDGLLSNRGQMGMAGVSLTVPFVTYIACRG